ncbi:MAG: iron-sulfur cluster assembly scaffold protein [Patescibacteria group bacterium]|nr:iron-sulfur cluster assembly scaffold protein [Patescibacteria group bacterium]
MPDINSLYSKKVMDHFRNPRNVGEIKNPDGVATVGNKVCGDVMRMFLKVAKKKNKEYISEIKFQTLGCGAAIATSSMATELIKGKTLDEAERITNKVVTEALGGLPEAKRHCSVLAEQAVLKAIKNYKKGGEKN